MDVERVVEEKWRARRERRGRTAGSRLMARMTVERRRIEILKFAILGMKGHEGFRLLASVKISGGPASLPISESHQICIVSSSRVCRTLVSYYVHLSIHYHFPSSILEYIFELVLVWTLYDSAIQEQYPLIIPCNEVHFLHILRSSLSEIPSVPIYDFNTLSAL